MANSTVNFTSVAYNLSNANAVSLELVHQAEAIVSALLVEKNKRFTLLEKETQEKVLAKNPDFLHSLTWTETITVGHSEYCTRDLFRILAKDNNIFLVGKDGNEYTNTIAIVDAMTQYSHAYMRGHNRKEKLVTKKPSIFVAMTNQPVFYDYDIAARHVDGVKEGLNPLQHLASRSTELRDALKSKKSNKEVSIPPTVSPENTQTTADTAVLH